MGWKYLFLFVLLISGAVTAGEMKFWNGCGSTDNDRWTAYDPIKTGDDEILDMRIDDENFNNLIRTEFFFDLWGDSDWANNSLQSPKALMLNALYVLYKGGDGLLIREAFSNVSRWVTGFVPVCMTDAVMEVYLPDYTLPFKDIKPRKVSYSTSLLASSDATYNVVSRAATIYHESLHVSLNQGEHVSQLASGTVVGQHIMWLVWFSANAYQPFSDTLRILAANNANNYAFTYQFNSSFNFQPNITPRRNVIPWGNWGLPTYNLNSTPGVAIAPMTEEACYRTYAWNGQFVSWVHFPSPGVCSYKQPSGTTSTSGTSTTPGTSSTSSTPRTCAQICNGHNECMAKTPECRN